MSLMGWSPTGMIVLLSVVIVGERLRARDRGGACSAPTLMMMAPVLAPPELIVPYSLLLPMQPCTVTDTCALPQLFNVSVAARVGCWLLKMPVDSQTLKPSWSVA